MLITHHQWHCVAGLAVLGPEVLTLDVKRGEEAALVTLRILTVAKRWRPHFGVLVVCICDSVHKHLSVWWYPHGQVPDVHNRVCGLLHVVVQWCIASRLLLQALLSNGHEPA